MGVSVVVVANLFPGIAAQLEVRASALLAVVAEDRFHAAQDSSPVDTGAMQADHAWMMVSPLEAEITVQKDATGRTYAFFNDSGTIHYAGSHWFSNAMAGTGASFEAHAPGSLT